MDIASITNLGTGGLAIVVMWWMYKDMSDRSERLNKEVRDNIMAQLTKNTAAFEKVLEHLSKH